MINTLSLFSINSISVTSVAVRIYIYILLYSTDQASTHYQNQSYIWKRMQCVNSENNVHSLVRQRQKVLLSQII